MAINKRKKHHDKDKYYKLAKEQGYRSRAAFKLSQINRRYNLIDPSSTRVVLDLCAAPGGWTQVVARTLPQSGSVIVAVDLLPIRAVAPHVLTLVGDVTTETCRAEVSRKLQALGGGGVDVVLCDGAPDVGGNFEKDAYVQNEIALACLKCATQHLRRDGRGSFLTKLYRSRDYASYAWVCRQLFRTVEAVKPTSSRSQSAEIFLVCRGYRAPTTLDPRLLDPKHVFASLDDDNNGNNNSNNKIMDVTKESSFSDAKTGRRSRQGYDTNHLDFTMRHVGTVRDFLSSRTTVTESIRMLGECTGLSFTCEVCRDFKSQSPTSSPPCRCASYLAHPRTTAEIKACVVDLKVLGRADFHGILRWRQHILADMAAEREGDNHNDDSDDDDDMDGSQSEGRSSDDDDDNNNNNEEDEDEIQKEIATLRRRKLREAKRRRKKERELKAKRRRRMAGALTLDDDNDNTHADGGLFRLSRLKADAESLERLRRGEDAADENDDDNNNNDDDDNDDDDVSSQGEPDDVNEETNYSYRLDRELDAAYDAYLEVTKNKAAKVGTKMDKRLKKKQKERLKKAQEEDEAADMVASGVDVSLDADTRRYAQLLEGTRGGDGNEVSDDDNNHENKDSDNDDNDDDDDDDDGFHDKPATPAEHKANRANKAKQASQPNNGEGKKPTKILVDVGADDKVEKPNPLIVTVPKEAVSVRAARWFSNPVFADINEAVSTIPSQQQQHQQPQRGGKVDGNLVLSDDNDDDDPMHVETLESDEEDYRPTPKAKGKATARKGPSVSEILASIPKTDKQKRHEKRLKAMAREERKKQRKAKAMEADEMDDENTDMQVVPKPDVVVKTQTEGNKTEQEKALLKAGLGIIDEKHQTKTKGSKGTKGEGNPKTHLSSKDDANTFEVVPPSTHTNPLIPPIVDPRSYGSDDELYDSDDHARTLALATMTLRRSKLKSLVDASYNRFAWNDPSDLPDWFLDDEARHYRPQLPIPAALLDKMKQRQLDLASKPIAKVAEARARKNKRSRTRLAAARKAASAVVQGDGEGGALSEASKLRAVARALRRGDADRRTRTTVVAHKDGSSRGGKGVRLVDKRLKNDKRAMARTDAKRKRGGKKAGGLTGNRKRRHHS